MARRRFRSNQRHEPTTERSFQEYVLSTPAPLTSRTELLRLIRGGEDTFLELKVKLSNSEKIAQEIVALANTGGGVMVFGVNDQLRIEGVDNPEGVQDELVRICREDIEPSLMPFIDRIANSIDERRERRLDVFTTDAHELVLNSLGIVYTFDSQLIVDTKNHHAAARICQGNNFLRNFFGVGKFDLQLQKRVFAAAYQAQQFGAGSLRSRCGKEVFLKGTLGSGFVSLVTAKSSASHLCIDGALSPARTSRLTSLVWSALTCQRFGSSRPVATFLDRSWITAGRQAALEPKR